MVERRAKIEDAAVNIRRAFWLVWDAHPPSALAILAEILAVRSGAYLVTESRL